MGNLFVRPHAKKKIECFILLALLYSSLFAPITFAQNTSNSGSPAPIVNGQYILNDPRTASELPTKEKIPTNQPIDVKRKESDRQIQVRLTQIAHSQEIFQNVQISVVEGIVTLKGQVDEDAYAKSLSALSERVEGVIGVIDSLDIKDTQKTGIRLAQSEVSDLVHKFFKFIPYLVSCFVVLLITIAIGIGTAKFWRIVLSRKIATRPLLVPHLTKIFTAPVYLIGAYLILQIGGAAGLAATLVGGTGVLGIVLGLAGKNILEDILSSFMLTLRNPFKIGDEVVIGDQAGVVNRMDSRCTMLLTYDGVLVQIPNSTVLGAIIKNISAHPVNRVSFHIDVSLELGFTSFKKFFDKTIELNKNSILADPKPKAVITGLNRRNSTVQCTFWVDTRLVNDDEVQSNVLHSLLHYLRGDEESLRDVRDSIQKTEHEPTKKEVLNDRSGEVHLQSH